MPTPFPEFHEALPPCGERKAYNPARHDAVVARVPKEVVAEWRSSGFGAYGGGLIWTVQPGEFVLDRRDWAFLDGSGIEILRTAFASVCVWQGGKFLWLNVHTGKVTVFPPEAEIMFEATLIGAQFRQAVLWERLFHIAVARFGELGADECFGFAPLPALGGAVAEKYLIKTVMRDYVALAGHVLKE